MTLSPQVLLDRAHALVPTLQARSEETEALRRLPDATIRDLVEQGFMRATLPARYGGLETDYRTIMEIVAIISRGCGSTGWVLCNLMSCTSKLGFWPEKAQDEIWSESIDAVLTGSFIFPCGRATRVDGGYRLSGRWPLSSGIDHAVWNNFAAMEENTETPTFRMLLLPKSDYTIIDTWHAAGLRGTGSKDVEVKDVFVPEHRTLDANQTRHGTSPGAAVNPGALYRLPMFAMFFSWVGSAILGIAEGAVDGFVEDMKNRVARYTGARVADYASIQIKIGEARAAVAAARHLYLQNCDHAHAIIDAGSLPDAETRARYRSEGAYAAKLCYSAVDLIAAASGGGGVYDHNPLSRALRDINTGRAHITQTWEPNATTYGRVALGLETDNPLL